MDKKNWLQDILKFAILALQVYVESSNNFKSLEKYIKKSVKTVVLLIIMSIPVILTIYGGIFISIFFYLTTQLNLPNYAIVLILVGINIILLIAGMLWFKYKIKENKFESDGNLNLFFISLIDQIKSVGNKSE